MTLEQVDLIAGWAGLVLTLMVFSYLLADNFLYRIAVHLLVGAAAVFVAVTAIEEVVIPWFDITLVHPDADAGIGPLILGALPLVIVILLLFKSIPRYNFLSNLGSSVVIGVGTGVALVGVVMATLLPLVEDTGRSVNQENGLNALILIGGTICTLISFQYLSRRRRDGTVVRPLPIQALAWIGQGFIAVTLGALYAGAILTSLTIFSSVINEQLRFLLEQLGG